MISDTEKLSSSLAVLAEIWFLLAIIMVLKLELEVILVLGIVIKIKTHFRLILLHKRMSRITLYIGGRFHLQIAEKFQLFPCLIDNVPKYEVFKYFYDFLLAKMKILVKIFSKNPSNLLKWCRFMNRNNLAKQEIIHAKLMKLVSFAWIIIIIISSYFIIKQASTMNQAQIK